MNIGIILNAVQRKIEQNEKHIADCKNRSERMVFLEGVVHGLQIAEGIAKEAQEGA